MSDVSHAQIYLSLWRFWNSHYSMMCVIDMRRVHKIFNQKFIPENANAAVKNNTKQVHALMLDLLSMLRVMSQLVVRTFIITTNESGINFSVP